MYAVNNSNLVAAHVQQSGIVQQHYSMHSGYPVFGCSVHAWLPMMGAPKSSKQPSPNADAFSKTI